MKVKKSFSYKKIHKSDYLINDWNMGKIVSKLFFESNL